MEKDEIIAKAHKVFQETSNEQEKYKEERRIIFNLLKDLNDLNIESLENMVNLYEKKLALEKESNKYNEIKALLNEFKEQETRKTDDNQMMHLFLLTDKTRKKYSFFTRKSANNFKVNNKEKFDENVDIKVDHIRNVDLERLINIIK